MIVGVCGLGYTGSGAVIDLLKEYDSVQVQRGGEFWISYRPDGLEDLAYHVNNPSRFTSSDVAILRFEKLIARFCQYPQKWGLQSAEPILQLTKEYIDSITQVHWKGFWTFDPSLSSKLGFFFKWRCFKKLYYKYPDRLRKSADRYLSRDMHLSVNPDGFYEKTQKYISDLLHLLGYDDNGIVALDQGFSGDNPLKSFPLFKNPKAIVVDKDPCDLYVLCKKEIKADCRWVPTDNVDDFIEYYRIIRQGYQRLNDEKILVVRFENLIYEYDKTKKEIETFLGLGGTAHKRPLTFFNPKKSINNTQLFRKYPELKEDINKIEQSLQNYIFPYENYPVLSQFGKSF